MLAIIKKDQLNARKTRNATLAAFLTTLMSEAARPGLDDGKRESTDAEVTAVLKKFIKNANEIMANLLASDDRSVNAQAEIDVCNAYLPTQMSEDEVEAAINNIVSTLELDKNMKSMGVVMKELKSTFGGTYDGKMASQILRKVLN